MQEGVLTWKSKSGDIQATEIDDNPFIFGSEKGAVCNIRMPGWDPIAMQFVQQPNGLWEAQIVGEKSTLRIIDGDEKGTISKNGRITLKDGVEFELTSGPNKKTKKFLITYQKPEEFEEKPEEDQSESLPASPTEEKKSKKPQEKAKIEKDKKRKRENEEEEEKPDNEDEENKSLAKKRKTDEDEEEKSQKKKKPAKEDKKKPETDKKNEESKDLKKRKRTEDEEIVQETQKHDKEQPKKRKIEKQTLNPEALDRTLNLFAAELEEDGDIEENLEEKKKNFLKEVTQEAENSKNVENKLNESFEIQNKILHLFENFEQLLKNYVSL